MFAECKQDIKFSGMSVTEGIRQGLLSDAENIRLEFRREFQHLALQRERGLHSRSEGRFCDHFFHGFCQFLFLQGNEPCEVSYAGKAGKYMGQRGTALPRM